MDGELLSGVGQAMELWTYGAVDGGINPTIGRAMDSNVEGRKYT